MRALTLSSLLLLAGASNLVAEAPRVQAADAPWKTLRTAHYRIHFPARGDFQPFAEEVAAKIEGIHAQVIAWVGYEVPGVIQVLIRDPQLEANGSAWPFYGRPWVELWKTPPEADSALAHHTSWVELLVTHELTHIHHLMRPQNRPNWTDRLLNLPVGPMTTKAPRWVIEGYATVIEGKITGSGRPHSAYRATLLRQWALQGKLPDYGAISGMGGFRGGSMAYLVGSAYLEWLERQNPTEPDILKTFWKRVVSKKRRTFEASFQATFGLSARDGYDRWRAEVTHDALALEQRAKTQNLLREGEVWARLGGEVTDLAVSPDGTKLLARVLTRDFKGLKVWELGATEKEQPQDGKAQAKAKIEKPDPNEVEDRKAEVPERKAKWQLGRVAGRIPEKPTWATALSAGGKEPWVRFSLRLPNAEGTLQRRGWAWSPSNQKTWLLPLGSGPTEPQGESPKTYGDRPGESTGTLYRLGSPKPQQVVRTLSAAWNAAPTPDGKWLYYTQLSAAGVDIRKLDLALPPLEDQPLLVVSAPFSPDTVIARQDEPNRLPAPVAIEAPGDYRVEDSLWNRGRVGASVGPAGDTFQFGYGGTDLLGRMSWLALAGLGEGAGPRGVTAAAVWRGWRWAPSLALFSSLERPSAQRVGALSGLDRERRGAEVRLHIDSKTNTPWRLQPFVAVERLGFLEARTHANRALGGATARLAHQWLQGEHLGFTVSGEGSAVLGRTNGEGWNHQRGRLALHFDNKILPLAFKGEWARVGGTPSPVDRLSLGGLESSLVPSGLDLNRLVQVALPTNTASGDRSRRWRGELGEGVRAYLEHAQVWSSGQPRLAGTRVAGVELALTEFLPAEPVTSLFGRLDLVLGLHRPLDGLLKDRTVVTLSLTVRP